MVLQGDGTSGRNQVIFPSPRFLKLDLLARQAPLNISMNTVSVNSSYVGLVVVRKKVYCRTLSHSQMSTDKS